MLIVKADAFASEIAIGASQAQITSTGLQAGLIAQLNTYRYPFGKLSWH
jgi:hypothetical protein